MAHGHSLGAILQGSHERIYRVQEATSGQGTSTKQSPSEQEEAELPNNNLNPCSSHDKKCLQKQHAKLRERMNLGIKMRNTGILPPREDTRPVIPGVCQSELHRALERLAASQTRTHEDLYIIPNCDRNGNFHPKQCHPALDGQRGKCWCVDRKTGIKLPGSLELKGDLDCHQPTEAGQA
uniref:Insulin-like growth factor-binding protein 4 n=1 Tax=Sphaerodactylus townsendi TaxID=933632 RepID=A0ACB8EUL2_9SAUR